MSTTTPNQGLVLPTDGDLNDVSTIFSAYNGGVERRLVQRFESATDRSVRNSTPDDGELSYLQDVDRYEGRINGQWVTLFSGSSWTTYTPAWTAISGTQPTLGNGTLLGRYQQLGKTIHVFMQLILGSTSTLGTAQWQLALPLPAVSGGGLVQVLHGRFFDTSASAPYTVVGHLTDGTTARLEIQGTNPNLTSLVASGPQMPFTPATGDYVTVEGTYEGA